MRAMVKAVIKVGADWGSKDNYEHKMWLADQLYKLLIATRDDSALWKTILNRNGNTSHIEVKI